MAKEEIIDGKITRSKLIKQEKIKSPILTTKRLVSAAVLALSLGWISNNIANGSWPASNEARIIAEDMRWIASVVMIGCIGLMMYKMRNDINEVKNKYTENNEE